MELPSLASATNSVSCSSSAIFLSSFLRGLGILPSIEPVMAAKAIVVFTSCLCMQNLKKSTYFNIAQFILYIYLNLLES
ncbi:hypothetical protein BpHYR1_038949 [Brachionus plicatilis]|uniref:Uncharacterized protein n=1 Tax=Brachionus plicatilis TaxID=10195 RepID=A0A3M7PMM2_BRAPC|nr:hypothetical protein BpHYR1_038949 [Brachionus plicatilis]